MAYKISFVFGQEIIELEEGYDPDEGVFYIDYDQLDENDPLEADEIFVTIICDTCEEAQVEYSIETDCHYFELDNANELAENDGWDIKAEYQCCDCCCGEEDE
jgi:hypothetical protein